MSYHHSSAESVSRPTAKYNAYGTVIFIPSDYDVLVDFGETWPLEANAKKKKCPRILLISTWADGKWGFVGGGNNPGESPIECMNREFLEEVGVSVSFTQSDYLFTNLYRGRSNHIYAKVTHDHSFFQSLFFAFHSEQREAYIDEVFSITGLPLWFESPTVTAEDMGTPADAMKIWGLPRLLAGNGCVGCFSSGILPDPADNVREQFLLVLLCTKTLSPGLVRKVISLTGHVAFTHSVSIKPWTDLIKTEGVEEILLANGLARDKINAHGTT